MSTAEATRGLCPEGGERIHLVSQSVVCCLLVMWGLLQLWCERQRFYWKRKVVQEKGLGKSALKLHPAQRDGKVHKQLRRMITASSFCLGGMSLPFAWCETWLWCIGDVMWVLGTCILFGTGFVVVFHVVSIEVGRQSPSLHLAIQAKYRIILWLMYLVPVGAVFALGVCRMALNNNRFSVYMFTMDCVWMVGAVVVTDIFFYRFQSAFRAKPGTDGGCFQSRFTRLLLSFNALILMVVAILGTRAASKWNDDAPHRPQQPHTLVTWSFGIATLNSWVEILLPAAVIFWYTHGALCVTEVQTRAFLQTNLGLGPSTSHSQSSMCSRNTSSAHKVAAIKLSSSQVLPPVVAETQGNGYKNSV